MKRTVNKINATKFEIVCSVDTEAWKKAQHDAFVEVAKTVEIKGFRKGKAPLDLVKKHVDQVKVFDKAIGKVIQPVFEEAIKAENIIPFIQPSYDVGKLTADELELKYTVITKPEVEIGQYKDLGVKVEEVKVSDAEVDEEINKVVKQNADLVLSEEPSKIGDTVVIDFVGSTDEDGKEFDGGKGENYSLELGSKSFVPGFEDQLVGHKAGDIVEVKVTFPTQYVKELAGKPATFKTTIHEVKTKVIPELNDELVKEQKIANVETVAQYKDYTKANLTSKKEQEAKSKAFNTIIDKIVDGSKIQIADEIVLEEVNNAKEGLSRQLAQSGLTIEQYIDLTGSTNEAFEKKVTEDAIKNLKVYLVCEEIASKENITVEDKDCDFEFAKIAEQYKMEVEKVKEILGKDLPRFKNEIRARRINDFIMANNIAK